MTVVCDHWNGSQTGYDRIGGIEIYKGKIDLPLFKNINRPSFMHAATVDTVLQQERP